MSRPACFFGTWLIVVAVTLANTYAMLPLRSRSLLYPNCQLTIPTDHGQPWQPAIHPVPNPATKLLHPSPSLSPHLRPRHAQLNPSRMSSTISSSSSFTTTSPLTCRIPTYTLLQPNTLQDPSSSNDATLWTPFTIALQGTLQYSHIHLHTTINTIFHTYPTYSKETPFNFDKSRFLAATAYSLPNSTSTTTPAEGTKIIRMEPLVLSFNVGWVEGSLLPGMASRPIMKVTDHGVGFTLLSFFALAASAGVGAMAMLVYERRKSGRTMNGLLGGNTGGTNAMRTGNGYATGFGGYGGYASGKRD